MKSVMLSIKPKWCELIASGRKTIEVRKTRPKLEAPFLCYIYCTKTKNKWSLCDYEGDGYDDKGNIIYDTWICPCCEERYEVYYDNYKHCPNCGQALDWSDTDEMPNNKSQE